MPSVTCGATLFITEVVEKRSAHKDIHIRKKTPIDHLKVTDGVVNVIPIKNDNPSRVVKRQTRKVESLVRGSGCGFDSRRDYQQK